MGKKFAYTFITFIHLICDRFKIPTQESGFRYPVPGFCITILKSLCFLEQCFNLLCPWDPTRPPSGKKKKCEQKKGGLEVQRNHSYSLSQDKTCLLRSVALRGKSSLASGTGIKLQRMIVIVSLNPNRTKKFLKLLNKKETQDIFHPVLQTKFPCLLFFFFFQHDIRCLDHKNIDTEDSIIHYLKKYSQCTFHVTERTALTLESCRL